MKIKILRIIGFLLVLIYTTGCYHSYIQDKNNTEITTPVGSYIGSVEVGGRIVTVYFSQNDNSLEFFDDVEKEKIVFNPNAKEMEYFEIPFGEDTLYLRNFSPVYYTEIGQVNKGALILSLVNPIDKGNQPLNKSDFQVDKKTSINDKAFSFLFDYSVKKEKEIHPDLLCSGNDARKLLSGIESSQCYIRSPGKSEIFSQLLPGITRIVHLQSKSISLENDYKFFLSEEHTTIEINENGEWFVADPSFGIAYVKDVNGKRVNTEEIIKIISEKKSNELTFGLVENGLIYEISGNTFTSNYISFSGYYYTEDKTLEYSYRKNQSELPENLLLDKNTPLILQQYFSTIKYLEDFNFQNRYYKATDYGNPFFSPERIGLEPNNYVYEYDFDLLAKVEKDLSSVDRDFVLKQIYLAITSGARTDSEKHIALQDFLQRVSYHGKLQPMYPDKITVLDPILLLELSEMRCGHVARIGVDLWKAGGGEGRLVQAGSHITAEIFYDGDWHLLEGDLWENGVSVTDQDGSIPSVKELSNTPYLIDALPPILFDGEQAQSEISLPYPSYYFFNKHSYSTPAQFYYKVDAPSLSYNKDRYYGWNNWETKSNDEILLQEDPPFYQPTAVVIDNIEKTGKGNYRISWNSAKDMDNDLLGYRVYIGTTSRGWAYETSKSPKEILPFINTDWEPYMYPNLNELPMKDFGFFQTNETFVNIRVPENEKVFITIMPYDKHGENVGRTLYSFSDELILRGY